MREWIKEFIINHFIADFFTLTESKIPHHSVVLYFYKDGDLIFTPLRLFDQSAINIQQNSNTSLLIRAEDDQYKIIRLLGSTHLFSVSESDWDKYKVQFNSLYPKISELVEIKERFFSQIMKNSLFKFRPSKITAWDNLITDPFEIELEIIT